MSFDTKIRLTLIVMMIVAFLFVSFLWWLIMSLGNPRHDVKKMWEDVEDAKRDRRRGRPNRRKP